MRTIAAMIVLVLLGAGCYVLPTGRHTPRTAMTRSEIEDPKWKALEPGVSTRADVLLRMGEPDVVTQDERALLYRWESIAGYAGFIDTVEGGHYTMGTRRCDVAVELDSAGVVTRIGEVEKLAALPDHGEAALDLSEPLEVAAVEPGKAASRKIGLKLVMRRDALAIVPHAGEDAAIEIPAGRITAFRHESDDPFMWNAGWLSYQVEYRGPDGAKEVKRFRVGVLSLPLLARYLRQHSPAVKIQDSHGGGCAKTQPHLG